jgi:hypothetical protein
MTEPSKCGAFANDLRHPNRLATQKDMWATTLTFTFDAVGNRTKVQDSFGGVTTSAYNAVNLLSRTVCHPVANGRGGKAAVIVVVVVHGNAEGPQIVGALLAVCLLGSVFPSKP